MKLRPIGDDNLDAAAALLARGFTARPAGFWRRGLARLADYRRARGVGPVGQLLSVDGADAGVLLTIESRHRDAEGRPYSMVNLSSWYAEEGARWQAARLLQKAVAAEDTVYTDLSPTPAVRAINERLGFRLESEGSVLSPLPLAALKPARGAAVVPYEAGDELGLDPADARMLADHGELGAIAAVLKTGDASLPLIFQPTRSRGIAGARVLYADKAALGTYIGAIARFLLRRGFWFVEADHDEALRLPFGVVSRNRAVLYVKGRADPARINHAYSELVFFHANG